MDKKINGDISLGNILVILTMLASVIFSYSNLQANVDVVAKDVEKVTQNMAKKANKDVVEIQFMYINDALEEIKNLIQERDK
jgi:type II secretory pathway component PulC